MVEINHVAYCKLIAEDIDVIGKCIPDPDNLERIHIIKVLKNSVDLMFDEPYKGKI